jgi:hypothetical protein
LQIFYSVRSERMLIEQLQYNLLFRWFMGMETDEVIWNHAVYSKNRERLLNEEIAESFFQRVLERAKPFVSDELLTVDGTLIEAWAEQKGFRRKDGPGKPPGAGGEVDFHGQKRKNQTHQSTTDPDARLYKKSQGSEAKLGRICRDGGMRSFFCAVWGPCTAGDQTPLSPPMNAAVPIPNVASSTFSGPSSR